MKLRTKLHSYVFLCELILNNICSHYIHLFWAVRPECICGRDYAPNFAGELKALLSGGKEPLPAFDLEFRFFGP